MADEEKGASTLPCGGTPLIIGHVDEHESPNLTYCSRPTRKLLIVNPGN